MEMNKRRWELRDNIDFVYAKPEIINEAEEYADGADHISF